MSNSELKQSGIVSFEIEEQIGILTISNGIQNKIYQADFLELSELKEWTANSELKGIIINGQGRHFSAGADVNDIRSNRDNIEVLRKSLKKGKAILDYIESLPIVTVAAISGICFGAGLEITLSCQFRICTTNSVIAFPESNLGIMPGLGGTVRLPGIIGKSKALDIILSGRTIAADEAYAIGLVDRVVPGKEHIEAAKAFINELTQNIHCEQIKSIIGSINNSVSQTNQAAFAYEEEMFLELVKKYI